MKTYHSKTSTLAVCFSALFLGSIGVANASEKLSCAKDEVTSAYLCFPDGKVRANDVVRAVPFYKGGPNGADNTGFTARVHCISKVMELTDRQGVAFVRNKPTEQVGLDFIRILCAHKPAKIDPKLSTQ